MNFKKLNLDQSKINQAIEKFGLDDSPIISKKGHGTHYQIKKDGKEALVIFYFKKDGTTSIDPSVGSNPELSAMFCEFIIEFCATNLNSGSISVPALSDEHFTLLFEYLKEIVNADIISNEEHSGFKRFKLKSKFKDEVTISHYQTKTLLVQGRPLYLFEEIKLFLYGLIPLEQVAATESETYKIDIKADQIRIELQAFMPTAHNFLEEKIKKILTPSLSLRKLEIELEDYSCFAFPALRGLEGYIRQLLFAKGSTRTVQNIKLIGKLFDDGSSGEFKLADWAKREIPCTDTCFALEKAYNLYKAKRHPYFHVEGIVATTPIIWKKEDAESLVIEVFETIEETFSKIP